MLISTIDDRRCRTYHVEKAHAMKLGQLEQKTINHIWSQYPEGSFTVRDIVDDLHNTGDEYAYNTILTVMTHLHRKKLLNRRKEGKTCTYTVRLTRNEFIAKTSQDFFKRMSTQYGSVAIAHFANLVEELDPKLLEQARRELEQANE